MRSYNAECLNLAVLLLFCCFGLGQAQTCRLPVHGYTIAGVYPGMTKEALDELGLEYRVEPNPGHDLYIFSDPRIEYAQFSQDMVTTIFGYELMHNGKVLVAKGAEEEVIKGKLLGESIRMRGKNLVIYKERMSMYLTLEDGRLSMVALMAEEHW